MTRRKRKYLIVISLLLGGCVASYWGYQNRADDSRTQRQPGRELVILVHGLGRGPSSMEPLRAPLEQAGYDVHNWAYDSMGGTIAESSGQLRAFLTESAASLDVNRVHLVTHSLGGILVREALTRNKPGNIGRVVMLAPPNQGSASARFWAPFAGRLIKPLAQLSDDPDSSVNQLGIPAGVDIGIIAAAQDGKVKVADTHLAGEADHLVVPGFHTFIMHRDEVAAQVVHFIQNGRFDHTDTAENDAMPSDHTRE